MSETAAERMRKLRHEIECLEHRELELRYERAVTATLAWHDGLTQAAIGEAVGMSVSMISLYAKWVEIVELARGELRDDFICSAHAVAGLANGDYDNDEILSILDQASGWASKRGQLTELDVWEAVSRNSSWRRKYGSVPGYNRHRRRSYR